MNIPIWKDQVEAMWITLHAGLSSHADQFSTQAAASAQLTCKNPIIYLTYSIQAVQSTHNSPIYIIPYLFHLKQTETALTY